MARLTIPDRDAYVLYVYASVGMASVANAAAHQAQDLKDASDVNDWIDVMRLWDNLAATSRVLQRLWVQLDRIGNIPGDETPSGDETSAAISVSDREAYWLLNHGSVGLAIESQGIDAEVARLETKSNPENWTEVVPRLCELGDTGRALWRLYQHLERAGFTPKNRKPPKETDESEKL
jgi:hypothetical protein